ncbi:MAG: copper amine oxidase N-terminal domain-containing protein [Clostridia bacterium]|nr:copper amine oxidase N-terminal domain-containing protein [Clostridia bacterium]
MKRFRALPRLLIPLLCLALLSSCVTNVVTGTPPTAGVTDPAVSDTPSEESTEPIGEATEFLGLYLGVQGYGDTERINKENAAQFLYRFYTSGQEKTYRIPVGAGENAYALQNLLEEGAFFRVTARGNVIEALDPFTDGDALFTVKQPTDGGFLSADGQEFALSDGVPVIRIDPKAGGALLYESAFKKGDRVLLEYENEELSRAFILPLSVDYEPPVAGTPGVKTLKNLLATALEPVGVCLYMFGGGWDWQDEGSGPQSVTLGLCRTWTDFFFQQDENYSYRDPFGDPEQRDKAHSFCPFGEFNEYYYAGLDCAGYLAWIAYNVTHTESGGDGYVVGGTPTAGAFASYGWGTFTQTFAPTDFKPGSVMSINGHVWMCVGVCSDGSMVIAHASPTKSQSGCPGGGVQLSAIGENETCEAYRLAVEYMTLFYPEWSRRNDVSLYSYSYYTSFTGDVAGLFTWDLENGVLTDPDGFRDLSAYEILAALFGYESVLGQPEPPADEPSSQEGTA